MQWCGWIHCRRALYWEAYRELHSRRLEANKQIHCQYFHSKAEDPSQVNTELGTYNSRCPLFKMLVA